VEGKAELVNREIVCMSPTGWKPVRAGLRIAAHLLRHEEQAGRGVVFPDNVGFVAHLPHRESFSPAAERDMAAKRTDYFACGTLVVWDVDLLSEDVIRTYKANDPEHPVIFRRARRQTPNRPCQDGRWQSTIFSSNSGSQ
jgi:Uma2 family endonuclease